jgi:nicotinamidase-related amidase
MSVEVVNRGGKWFVVDGGRERQFPNRTEAVETAKQLTAEPIPVIHERSAHVAAKLHTKGND